MTHTITLRHPVEVLGQKIDSLVLRRPKARDLVKLEDAKGSNSRRTFNLIADLANVAPEVVLELDPEDLAQINDWLEPILDPKGLGSKDAGS